MAGSGRPPPPLTVVVPGGETPAEVLADGRRDPSPALPLRLRALLLAVVAVLAAGVLVALDQQDRAGPAAPAVSADPALPQMTAQVGLLREQPLTALVEVVVTMAPPRASGWPRPAPQLKLLDVAGRGLAVRLVGRPPPLLLGHLGRFAWHAERVLRLPAEVAVADCTADGTGQSPLLLLVQRTGGPVGVLRAEPDPAALRAVGALARRTCRSAGG